MSKSYPSEVTDQLKELGQELCSLWRKDSRGLVEFAKACNLSVNSVKAVFLGKTGNITSYLMIAHTMGLTLEDIVMRIRNSSKSTTEEKALFS